MNTTFHTLAICAIKNNAVIPFNAMWKNTTGYLDGASEGPDAPLLQMSQVCTAVDDHGRRIVIIGCGAGEGNAVIFERFKDAKDDGVLVGNIPYGVVTAVGKIADTDEHGSIHSRIEEAGMKNLLTVIAPNGVQYTLPTVMS